MSIYVPSRHHHKQRSISGEARQEVVGEPVPCLVACIDTVRFFPAFDRIIDHAKMQFEPVDLSRHGGVAEAALMVDELDQAAVSLPAIKTGAGGFFRYPRAGKYLLEALTCDDALKIGISTDTEITEYEPKIVFRSGCWPAT
jgi:hypothetical protein